MFFLHTPRFNEFSCVKLMFVLFVGDEMGMIEDVCVSITNLTCVKFKVNMRLLNFIC